RPAYRPPARWRQSRASLADGDRGRRDLCCHSRPCGASGRCASGDPAGGSDGICRRTSVLVFAAAHEAELPVLKMALIQVRDLSSGYGVGPVLHRVSVRLNAGERAALIGANGAGKTTLLKVIAGLLRATSGCVQIDGQDVTLLPRRTVARLVAMVPQELVV